MAEMKQDELNAYSAACRALQDGKQSVLLSTLNQAGNPEISYAPAVRDGQGCFYIFVSELAAHTANLLGHPNCSVLFIQDEQESRNIFARERLTYQCDVEKVERDSAKGVEILEQMENKLGQTVKLLRGLPDFHLFRLKPTSGSYVVGFGKAFEVDPASGELIHLSEERVKR
ncbi:HugZ family protein [Pontibacterium sp.]|uniref:HugZ family pyridoxamine 5'-phosphate oxidase n=1 Tax=Pontibacterium sp. TaxID=2036026 RepID=UPI003514E89A